MLRKYFTALFAVLLGLNLTAQNIPENFMNPPQDARIRVWWHWMDSNITKEGIKADLDWMKRTGIAGVQQFDAGGDMMGGSEPIVERLPYMQAAWKDAFRYAIGYADSLGLEVAIASAPGWSSTGGPWVKPENAMKKLTWRTLEVTGSRRNRKAQVLTLPEPFKTVGKFQNANSGGLTGSPSGIEPWYSDVAVVAVRVPEDDRSMAELGAEVSSSGGTFTVDMLTDGDLANGSEIPAVENGTGWIQYSFPERRIIRAVTLVGGDVRGQWNSEAPSYRNVLQSSEDGMGWTDICRIPSGSVAQQTIDIPVTTARYFRLLVANPVGDQTYAALGYGQPAPKATPIHEFVLHGVTRVNHAEEKAGFAAPHDLMDFPTPYCPDPVIETVDLTDKLGPDGTLTWAVPEGKWRIYRFGASLTGKQNHPAPPEATGLEVDKLDKEAWLDYFRQYMDMYKEAAGGRVGQHGIQYILTDSYEAEQMTWTPSLPEEFLRRRGYDLMLWLPALTGEVISSSEETERFLFDWRETLGELFAENYGRINDIAREYGMKGRYTESHENGRVYVGDGMDLKMTAAVPMSAFWMPGTGGGSTLEMAQADIRESASVAHVYGQNIAAAESFTAAGLSNNAWSYYPGNLKNMADLAMYSGVTRFVIHESAHQPSDAHKPGLGLMIFGQWFNRHETWAEYARYWADYLARSCWMLQQGKYAADILWYYGEDTNIAGIYGHELPPIPQGYSFDFINPYGVRNVLSVKDGKLTTESGMQYRVLVLGEHCKTMSLPVLRALAQLVKAGAVICGQVPQEPAGLLDNRAEFDRLVDDIWHSGRTNVHTGSLSGVLNALGVGPDFRYLASADLKFVHRTDGDRQIYWIRNFSDDPVTAQIFLRDAEGPRTVWNPETGLPLQGVLDGDRLTLEANQALFVVADKNGQPTPDYKAPRSTGTVSLDDSWSVSFEGVAAPTPRVFDRLASLTDFMDKNVKYFSGTTIYRNTFTLGKNETADGLAIDLGRVGQMADVWINGEHVQFLWKAPYKTVWMGGLKSGVNTLEIRVINTWPNRLIGDAQPGAEKHTYTSMPFYRTDSPLHPAGLIGPVRLEKLMR